MRKIFENVIWWSGVTVVGLILGLALQFVRAWTEPGQAPPGGNVGAPINTGPLEQLKQGALGINGLLKLYGGLQIEDGAGVGKVLTSDAAGYATWQTFGAGGGGLKAFVGVTSGSYNGQEVGGYDGGDQKCRDQFGSDARMCMAADFVLKRPTESGWFNIFGGDYFWTDDDGGSMFDRTDCRGWSTTSKYTKGAVWGSRYALIGQCNRRHKILCCK